MAKRQLKFIVNGQRITKDPSCNFNDIVAGTKNYLEAVFLLSHEWKNCVVAASFYKISDEFPVLLSGNRCMIPQEALTRDYFEVRLTGMDKSRDFMITTDLCRVDQERR